MTSTDVQPFLRAESSSSSMSKSATLSVSWPSAMTSKSTVPTNPPTRTDGRNPRTAPPASWRPASTSATLAFGRYTSWRIRPIASIGESPPGTTPLSAQSAYSRSTSVIRACLARYSTRPGTSRRGRSHCHDSHVWLTLLAQCRCSRGGERLSRSNSHASVGWRPCTRIWIACTNYTSRTPLSGSGPVLIAVCGPEQPRTQLAGPPSASQASLALVRKRGRKPGEAWLGAYAGCVRPLAELIQALAALLEDFEDPA